MNSSGKHPNPASDNVTDDLEVGYAKPPKRTRFRPGQSGNPAGRRKKVRNLRTDVQRTLKVPLTVKAIDPRRSYTLRKCLIFRGCDGVTSPWQYDRHASSNW